MKIEIQNKIFLWSGLIASVLLFPKNCLASAFINIDPWEFTKGVGEWTLAFLVMFWPLWVMFGVLLLFKIIVVRILPDWIHKLRIQKKFNKAQEWHSDRDLLYWLKGMKPSEFEEYIADLFSRLGFKTEVVGGEYDKGVDVIAEKDGIKHYIQCKKYYRWEVRVGDVRDFYGSIADYLTNGKGYFITTNKFTLEAEKFAEDKPIELIDSFKLISYIRLSDKNLSQKK
ncbi:MAG: restriction endonuclease [bacterium]